MPSVQSGPRISNRAIAACLAIVAMIPFARSLTFGYVMDDTYAIRGNASLEGWGSLLRVWSEQFGGDAGPFFGLYRPLTATLFAVVFNAGARWPLWFHIVALLAHALATVLVWRLLARALPAGAALLAALWFALHPLHVEAVANITNISEVLVAIFTVTLALFLLKEADRSGDVGWRAATVAGGLFLAAMLSKESGAMAAAVAALCVWGWRERPAAMAVRAEVRRWWRVAVAFVVAVIMVAVARQIVLGGPVTGEPIAAIAIAEMTAPQRIIAMLSLVPKIAALLVWPSGVNPHYGPSTFPASTGLPASLGVAGLLAAVVAVVIVARGGDRRPLVAVAWTGLAFLPASNLLVATGQVLAERTLYVPSIGVVMLGGVLMHAIRQRTIQASSMTRRVLAVAAVLILAVAGLRATNWTSHWRNHDALFARMIAADTAGYAGYWLSGIEATRKGRPAEGLRFFEQAYARYPRDRGLLLDLGAALTNSGQFARAVSVYREGLALAPGDSTFTARLASLGVR